MPSENSLERFLSGELDDLRARHQYRHRQVVRAVDATHVEIEGRRYVNFASNDYLGLTHHPRVMAAAARAIAESGVGSGAAALVCGYGANHARAEAAVAAWKGTGDAVLLPSGYQANHAAVQTLAELGRRRGSGRFLIDKIVHASLVDAVRGSGIPFRVFPHNGMGKLERLLAEAAPDEMQIVVSESIFSMDGDSADLPTLARLKQKHDFVLLLDEAHGSGVYGAGGAGYAAEVGLADCVDVTVVTFSKAMGCVGGAVCASKNFCEALVNLGRAYIFSTSIPAAIAAAVAEAIAVMRDEPARQARVRELARRVRQSLAADGLEIPPGDSPIIPILIGGDAEALEASRKVREAGLLIPAIRPPTVPRGSSRLRVTLSSDHTDGEVAELLRVVRGLRSGA